MPFDSEEVLLIKQSNTAKSLESWQEKGKDSAIEVTAFNFEENLQDPRVANMLRAIHSGVYSTTFPIPEEQEDVEDWIERGQENGRNPKQFITAHFANFEQALDLADQIAKATEKGQDTSELQKEFDALTIGFVVGEQYKGGSALINYVIRNKDFDGKTEGKPKFDAKEMVDHQVAQYREHAQNVNGEKLCFVGWEANNPKHTPFFDENGKPDFSVDVMDPQRRVQILEKNYGAKNTGFQWVQPPLSAGQEMCDTLFLYSYPLDDKSITDVERVTALRSFVNSFYETFPIKGKFVSDEGKFNAPEKFAKFCEDLAGKAESLVGGEISMLESVEKREKVITQYGEHKEEILEKVREVMIENDGNLTEEHLAGLRSSFSEMGFGEDVKVNEVLKLAFSDAAESFYDMQNAVEGMAKGLDEMARDSKKFYGKENRDDVAVGKGQGLLKEYYEQQDRESAIQEVKSMVAREAHAEIASSEGGTVRDRIAALRKSGMNTDGSRT